MMKRRLRFDLLTTLGVVLFIALLSMTDINRRIDAFSGDVLLALRHLVYGQRHPAADSPTVVIALDELTYRTEPFANLPKVLWTPHLAKVQDAVLSAGAEVIGYDVIFPTSLESYLPGYEKPLLRSMLIGARQGRVVLGMVQHSDNPVAPHPSQSMVVGNQKNIRPLNMVVDIDDVIRRIPLFFNSEQGEPVPSMALELASRAAGLEPQRVDGGQIALGKYLLPGSEKNTGVLNFQGGADIPTYSLADLYACVEAGESDYLTRYFRDKVVLIGGVLDVEDRKLTSKRLMTEAGAGALAEPCQLGRGGRG